jgi:hypothetical protein
MVSLPRPFVPEQLSLSAGLRQVKGEREARLASGHQNHLVGQIRDVVCGVEGHDEEKLKLCRSLKEQVEKLEMQLTRWELEKGK